jgi:hypothetical protein
MTTSAAVASVPTGASATTSGRESFWALARIEIVRLARHPLLLAGVAFGAFSTALSVQELGAGTSEDLLGMPVTALCVGVPAMIAAHRLTTAFRRAGEVVETAPMSTVTRTGAMCTSAVVPVVMASMWLVFYYASRNRIWMTPEWMLGTLSDADVAMILVSHTAIAATGGTLLGIAAARWWRFRGAAVVLVLGVTIWTLGSIGSFSAEGVPAPWTRWIRLFTPLNAFSNPAPDGSGHDTMTGAPGWYFVWLLTLCALAGLAALLKGSEGSVRRRLVRVGAVLLAISALTYVLAAAGGNSSPVRTYPDGHSVVLTK